MKFFWKAQILEVAESDIICVKSRADHDFGCDYYLLSYKPSLSKNSAPKYVRKT